MPLPSEPRAFADRRQLHDDLTTALGYAANLELPDWPPLVACVEAAVAHLRAAVALVEGGQTRGEHAAWEAQSRVRRRKAGRRPWTVDRRGDPVGDAREPERGAARPGSAGENRQLELPISFSPSAEPEFRTGPCSWSRGWKMLMRRKGSAHENDTQKARRPHSRPLGERIRKVFGLHSSPHGSGNRTAHVDLRRGRASRRPGLCRRILLRRGRSQRRPRFRRVITPAAEMWEVREWGLLSERGCASNPRIAPANSEVQDSA